MGVISLSAANMHHTNLNHRVKCKARLTVSELIGDKGIPIIPYGGPTMAALSSVNFKSLLECQRPYIIPPVPYYANLLW